MALVIYIIYGIYHLLHMDLELPTQCVNFISVYLKKTPKDLH